MTKPRLREASDAPPEPPADVGAAALAWWRSIVSEWRLAPDELAILGEATRALDRVEQARAAMKRDGTFVPSLHGDGERLHPGYVLERDQRLAFGRLVKQLNLPHAQAPAAGSAVAIRPRRKRGA